MSKSARQSAFEILYKVERSGAYSNLALDAQLSSKDGADGESALLTALVYGVLERLITLDYDIALYLRQPLKKAQAGGAHCAAHRSLSAAVYGQDP